MTLTDISKVDVAMRSSIGLTDDEDVTGAAYGKVDGWDSVAHMQLVAALEDAFNIMIETDDVIAMSDYPTIVEILRNRYGVRLTA